MSQYTPTNKWLLRRGPKGVVHRAHGGPAGVLSTPCGQEVDWSKDHKPWERKAWYLGAKKDVTCKKCLS
jgi:hypothetical protein